MTTHPVFVVRHITEDIIQVQDAPIAVFHPVNLQPVAGVLRNTERDEDM